MPSSWPAIACILGVQLVELARGGNDSPIVGALAGSQEARRSLADDCEYVRDEDTGEWVKGRPDSRHAKHLADLFRSHMYDNARPGCSIALLVPTIGLREGFGQGINITRNLELMFTSIGKTWSRECELGVILAYDAGDLWYMFPPHRERIEKMAKDLAHGADLHWAVNPGSRTYVNAVNVAAAKGFNLGYDYLFQINDDVQFKTKGWDTIFVNRLREMGNIGAVGRASAPILFEAFVGKAHMCIFGSFFPENFKNWYTDNWITKVYQLLGRLRQLDEVHIANYHTVYPRYEPDNSRRFDWEDQARDGHCWAQTRLDSCAVRGNSHQYRKVGKELPRPAPPPAPHWRHPQKYSIGSLSVSHVASLPVLAVAFVSLVALLPCAMGVSRGLFAAPMSRWPRGASSRAMNSAVYTAAPHKPSGLEAELHVPVVASSHQPEALYEDAYEFQEDAHRLLQSGSAYSTRHSPEHV